MNERELDNLLTEQVAYYRAIAPEYERHALDLPGADELGAALDAFGPSGDVLELACGTGVWTQQLLRHASTVTAVDVAPEMLAIARSQLDDARVRWIEADIFDWTPRERYDVVSFAFWLSHVPEERFDGFWQLVRDCLRTGGRVLFVDDAFRTAGELVEGEKSPLIERRLEDGTPFRIFKMRRAPDQLQERIGTLGWKITVHSTSGPFFWGEATQA